MINLLYMLLVLVIMWMSLSPVLNQGSPFYVFRNTWHTNLTIVVGTTVIFLVGFLGMLLSKQNRRSGEETV